MIRHRSMLLIVVVLGSALVAMSASAQRPQERFRPSWSFGARLQNTETGVRVTRVERNSPAQALGVEVGDLIVTVDGQQVGRVGGRIVDADQIITRSVERSGRALLLIQDRNDLKLLNATVQRTQGGSGNRPTNPGIDTIEGWFRSYLGRPLKPAERLRYQRELAQGTTLRTIQNQILSSEEYYKHAGDRPYLFVTALFEDLLKRPPSDKELKDWLDLYAAIDLDRVQLVQRFRSNFKV